MSSRTFGRGAVGHQLRDLRGGRRERRGRRLVDRVQGHALRGDRLGGEALALGDQAEDEVFGQALGVAGGLGRVVGGHHDVARAGRVAAEALAGVQVGRFLGHEALLRRLAGDPHALADVGPGRARTSGLVHEVADEVVGHLAEVLAGDDGVLELFQRLRMHLLDRGDEFVEAYG